MQISKKHTFFQRHPVEARIEYIMNVQSHICTNDTALVSYFQSRPRAAGEDQVVFTNIVYVHIDGELFTLPLEIL